MLPLSGKAKIWASRYLRPLLDCLNKHFEGDAERFLDFLSRLPAHDLFEPVLQWNR